MVLERIKYHKYIYLWYLILSSAAQKQAIIKLKF